MTDNKLVGSEHPDFEFVPPGGTTTLVIPAYIDPAVLVPGQKVRCIIPEDDDVVLTVVKVEPSLICSKPDGSGVIVLAHTVVPVRDDDVCGCGHDFTSHDQETDGCEPFGLCAECLAVQP